jgi:hypothetical protein
VRFWILVDHLWDNVDRSDRRNFAIEIPDAQRELLVELDEEAKRLFDLDMDDDNWVHPNTTIFRAPEMFRNLEDSPKLEFKCPKE